MTEKEKEAFIAKQRDTTMVWVCVCGLLCLLFFACGLTGYAVAIGILTLLYGIIMFYGYSKTARARSRAAVEADKKLRETLNYDDKTRILTVIQRSSKLEKIIRLEKSHDISMHVVPTTLHIGAVTVGGVTTGGTYTTGGYTAVSQGAKNGRCRLLYRTNTGDTKSICRIQLTDTLYEKAKVGPISQYLDHATKQIVVESGVTWSKMESDLFLKGLSQNFYDSRLFTSSEPTLEKGRAILAWITVNDA